MKCDICGGPVTEQTVTYRIELSDRLIVVENVPAKVCLQCGERLYSAGTVERLQRTVWEDKPPSRVLETPVFDFAGV
ncbi:MAG: type II toxin-antitoxin system MqsA family antitoxin [Gemmatimonadetes bacterium]|jgi:YgiT-type zinc finger domain-containing protein|nr:type II toxin-antitoxin system MqsA family antitoxin [Gemmatimonadota bacterium]